MTENDKNLLEKSVHFEQAPVDVMFAVIIWISEIGRNTSVYWLHQNGENFRKINLSLNIIS